MACACIKPLTEAELSDPGIKARVESALREQKNLDLRYIDIDVHQGIVTVSGMADSNEARRLIERLVRRIRGVEQAIVNVAVSE